jgi:hypothetical protein
MDFLEEKLTKLTVPRGFAGDAFRAYSDGCVPEQDGGVTLSKSVLRTAWRDKQTKSYIGREMSALGGNWTFANRLG